MTAPVKERGTRRSFSENSPWGKNLARGRAGGFQGQRPNFLTPGRGLQGSPAQRSRNAPERPSLLPHRRAAAL